MSEKNLEAESCGASRFPSRFGRRILRRVSKDTRIKIRPAALRSPHDSPSRFSGRGFR